MRHLKIKVSGVVQGVFFRAETKTKAESLNLKGFAKNESDGSVYMEVEGEGPQLEQFLKWCKEGPDAAHVDTIDVEYADELQHFSDFQIQ